MNYPVWDVPHLGSGLVIALIAIFHIMIAHFAVGGGLFLPLAEAMALRRTAAIGWRSCRVIPSSS